MDNVNFTTQAGIVFIQVNGGDITPFYWAGRKAQLGEISTPYGALTTTTAFDPRGGIYNDGTLVAEPGEVTSELTIKHVQHSRMRTEFIGKTFNIDKRVHIDGKDRDSAVKWVDIERMVNVRVTDRTTAATTSSGEEEALITLPVSGQNTVDIYRTNTSSITIAGLDVSVLDVDVGTPIGKTDKGIVYAVTTVNVAHTDVSVLVNRNGGAAADWDVNILSGVTDVPKAIIGFGNFVGILFSTYMLRSDTYGNAFSQVTPASWAGMNGVFGLDQTALFSVGDNGLISRSEDSGRTWTTSLQANTVTSENLKGGFVVDERVLYVFGDAGTVLRSDDFGKGWYEVTTPTTENILALTAPNRDRVFFIDNTGTIYQSADSGITVVEQASLEGLPAGVYTTASINTTGDGVFFVMVGNGTLSYIYRNVDGGADGYWYVPKGVDTTSVLNKAVMMDVNSLIAVGGTSVTSEVVNIQ